MLINSRRLSVVLLLVITGLTACGSDEKKEVGQVAANVNGHEITIYQINQVLAHATGVTEANLAQARHEILDKLIDQELAVTKATDAKLDRSPEVVMALDAARREILAKAYYEQVANSAVGVESDKVKSYFDDHPALFSNRRIYSMVDIAFKSDDKAVALVKNMVASNKPMQEIAQALKANGTLFEAHNYNSPAEKLSLEMLPSIAKLSDGQTGVVLAGPVVHVINVIKSQQAPVTFEVASPMIQKYLSSADKQALVAAEMKRLKDTAKIEYVGEFNKASAPVAAPTASVKASEDKAAEAASIAKGAAGIK